VSVTNQAQRRLMTRGKWVGTYARYRVCINSACVTWPRQIETIESFQICNTPGRVRDQFFEFLSNGPGGMKEDSNIGYQLLDRGMAATFDDPIADAGNKVRVHSDVTEDSSLRILIQGYDENAQWIRTQDSGVWVDGEYVSISTNYQYTTKRFSNITGVQKPITNGPVRLYEYNTATSTAVKALAIYENDETVPLYRRSMIAGLSDMGSCDGSADCTNKSVVVMAKLRYIPVRVDNDYLLIGNLPAIIDMAKSIDYMAKNEFQLAKAYEASAVAELQRELESHLGAGSVRPLRVEHYTTFGAGAIENPVTGYFYSP